MMTESFTNHGTPELRVSDIEGYVNYLDKHGFEVFKEDGYTSNIGKSPNELSLSGYYPSEDGDFYSYHFWVYSLINVPARIILEHLKADIRITFLSTNLLFFILGIWLISRLKELSISKRIVFSGLLIFQPALWYIDWSHPEAWSGVLCFIGVLYYFTKRKYFALFAISIAATHFQPLFIPALMILIDIIRERGFRLPVLFKIFICSFWVILPPIFYLIHYSTPNLIADIGFIDTKYIGLKRLSSFFFDLNQGAILGIPLPLLLLIVFLVHDLIRKRYYREYNCLIAVLLMSLFFMQMGNWNHGHAVVNRYVVWNAAILIIAIAWRLSRLKPVYFYSVNILIIATQIPIIFSQQDFNKRFWHANHFNELSKYVMSEYPFLYNPEPDIFLERTSPHVLSTTDSVAIFTDNNEKIRKMLIREGSESQLIERGVKAETVDSLINELDFYNGYAFINSNYFKKIGYDQDEDSLIDKIESGKEERIKRNIRRKINNSNKWFESIKNEAKTKGVSVDSILNNHVNYIFQKEKDDLK